MIVNPLYSWDWYIYGNVPKDKGSKVMSSKFINGDGSSLMVWGPMCTKVFLPVKTVI